MILFVHFKFSTLYHLCILRKGFMSHNGKKNVLFKGTVCANV